MYWHIVFTHSRDFVVRRTRSRLEVADSDVLRLNGEAHSHVLCGVAVSVGLVHTHILKCEK